MFDIATSLHGKLMELLERFPATVFNLYPPYLGAGIRVDEFSEDFRYVEVRLELNALNQNYMGTQFGGSLYSMCDPFFMLMVNHNLADGYTVWDKAGSVRYRRPGTGTVFATFELDDSDLRDIRREIDQKGVAEPYFEIDVVDDTDDVVAEVTKTLHVEPPD